MRPRALPSLRRPPTPARGFTLVEAVAAMVVLSVAAGSSALLMATSSRAYADAAAGARLSAEASVALARIVAEITATGRDPAIQTVSVPAFTAMTTTSVTWPDGRRVSLVGSSIMLRGADGEDRLLLADASLDLRAFNEANAPLAASLSGAEAGQIQRIQITITAVRNGVAQSLRTRAFLRCTALTPGVTP